MNSLETGLKILDNKRDEIMKAQSMQDVKFSLEEIKALDNISFLIPFKLNYGFKDSNTTAQKVFDSIKHSDTNYAELLLFVAKRNPVIAHAIAKINPN